MPFPQNKQDREVRRYSLWMILWIMIALAILTWIFGFTYGEEAAGIGLFKMLFPG